VSRRLPCLLLPLLCVTVSFPSRGQNSATSTYTKAQEDAFVSELLLPLSHRKRARSEPPLVDRTTALFDDITFERRVWNEMMVNVREARNIPSLLGELREIGAKLDAIDKSSPDRFSKIDGLQKRQSELRPRLELARRAERRLQGVILHLSNLLDARAVRLIAPFLNEEDVSTSGTGFDSAGSLPAFVKLMLLDLERAGVFDSGISQANKTSIDEWRKWWSLHKADFGQVYEPQPHQPKVPTETEPRSVLVPSTPIASDKSPELHKATEIEIVPERNSTWYWVASAVCLALVIGLLLSWKMKWWSSSQR
jgi:hypothetical protein